MPVATPFIIIIFYFYLLKKQIYKFQLFYCVFIILILNKKNVLTKNDIKLIKSLKYRKHRVENNLFVIEGLKIISEFINSDWEVKKIFLTNDTDLKTNLNLNYISNSDLKRISFLKSPNKVLALVKIPKLIKNIKGKLIIALDGVQDPGNLGSIIRLADWFGVSNILCSKNCVDVYNPKVVQSTMGSILRVSVNYVDLIKEIQNLSKYKLFSSVLDGRNINDIDINGNSIILFGNESKGISEELISLSENKISIPKLSLSKIDSLNVSNACAIVLNNFIR